MTRREETYIRGYGGTAKKAKYESSLKAREEREPASKQRDDNAMGADDAMREYLDTITSAVTAKEERMQDMAEAAKRKDDQLADMMARLDAKDKQMSDLIEHRRTTH